MISGARAESRLAGLRRACWLLPLLVEMLLAGLYAAELSGEPSVEPLNALMQRLAARRHGHVSFTETHVFALLDKPLESAGELLYDAPDRLEKRTLVPKPETLIVDHGAVTARRGRHTYTLSLSDYPDIVPFIESIRATLAGDRVTLERLFEVQLSGELARWRLVLVPRDRSVAGKVRRIEIAGTEAHLESVRIEQADGDRSLLQIGPEITP